MKLFSDRKNSGGKTALLLVGAVVMCVATLLGTAAAEASKYLLFRKPTVSKTQIAFSYGGDHSRVSCRRSGRALVPDRLRFSALISWRLC